jgi:signal transduction histidine kinase
MLDAIPFLRRQPIIIIMFGVLAWLLAVWQLTQVAVSQGVGLYLLLAQSALWYMAYCNIAEWQAHQETATAHAQLHATQQLLSQAVARNERTRIACDLHDQMGHHCS